ncbi:MAG: sugar phosphate isomerase/epimerase family protein [Phycisphaerae bacterium]
MRLGGKVFDDYDSPEQWVAAVRANGYRAAGCPVQADADDDTIAAYAQAAADADIVIAEVGAWSNPIATDEQQRKDALDKCIRQLRLAERIGATCCVNIAGSRGEKFNGPHETNFTRDTFDLIVESIRTIIDAVNPTCTKYTLETKPWIFPDTPKNYLELLEAIDRDAFAVHLDAVNMISSPRRYFDNARFIRRTVRLLGPHIVSCHVKDVILHTSQLIHIDECRPGTGGLDIATFMREVERVDPELPFIMEHLPSAEEYRLAAEHLRSIASTEGLTL